MSLEKNKKYNRHFFAFSLSIFVFFLASFIFFTAPTIQAATAPSIISYQGKLLVNNLSVTTSVNMKFVLYSAASGGTALYSASGTVGTPLAIAITPTSGLFTVNLGDTGTNSLDPTIFRDNGTAFLEVIVGSETLAPRKQIAASPYAFNARYLDGVGTNTNSSTTYIPVSDATGNFNFNHVTSTALYASGTSTISTLLVGSPTSTITTTFFKLTVDGNGDGSFIAYGTSTVATLAGGTGLTSLPSLGDGSRLFWYPKKAAFRAGAVSSTQWDDSNIGMFSTALGYSTMASGQTSFAFGSSTIASGAVSFAFGRVVTSSAQGAFALGQNLLVSGAGSFGINVSTTAYTLSTANTIALLGGNVGIGTTTPEMLLSVAGTLQVTGDTTLESTAIGDLTVTNTSTFAGDVTVGSEAAPVASLHVPGKRLPASVFTTSTNADPRSVAISGNYLYVTNFASNTLQIFDITSPINPRLVNTQTTHAGPVHVLVDTGLIYITNYTSGTVQIFQQIDPTNLGEQTAVTLTGSRPTMIGSEGALKTIVKSASNTVEIYQYSATSSTLKSINATIPTDPNPTSIDNNGLIGYVGTAAYVDTYYVAEGITLTSTSLSGASGTTTIKAQGNYVYAVNSVASKLFILDVSKPTSPVVVGSIATAVSSPTDLVVQGRTVYVTYGTGTAIEAFDVSSSTAPTSIGSVAVTANAKSLVIRGRYAYVVEGAATGAGTLRIFDLGGAYIQQAEIGGLQVGNIKTSNLLQAQSLSVFGGATINNLHIPNALVANEITADSLTVDGSASAGTFTVSGLTSLATLETSGSATFNASVAFAQGLTVTGTLQINAGSALQVNGTSTLGSTNTSLTSINGLLVLGSNSVDPTTSNGAMFYNTSTNKFRCYENSSWANCIQGIGAGTAGNLVYWETGTGHSNTSSLTWTTSTTRLTIGIPVVTSTGNMQFLVSGKMPTTHDSFASTGVGAEDMVIQDGYAYEVNSTSGTFEIFDVASSSINKIFTTSTPGAGYSIAVQGRYAYIVTNSSTLLVYDVKSPSSSVRLVGTGTLSGGQTDEIKVQGNYAYTISLGNGGTVVTYDISNPASPKQAGIVTLQSEANPNTIFLRGNYAFVGASTSLQILDISNPKLPTISSSSTNLGDIKTVYVQGRYAYLGSISGSTGYLYVVDISNVSSPVKVGTETNLGSDQPRSLVVQGRFVYIGNAGNNNLRVYDISNNPAVPVSFGSLSTSAAVKLAMQGRYLYLLSSNDRIARYDMGGAYIQQLEIGGLESESLSLRNSLTAESGVFSGGLTAGGNTLLSGNFGVTGSSTFFGSVLIGTTTLQGYNLFIDGGVSTTAALGVNGYIKASGFITETTTLDLAEIYPIKDSCHADGTCPARGDAVCLVDDAVATIEKCTSPYSEKAIGIISTDPGFTLGGLGSSTTRKVALAGRVPVKFSTINGSVKAGDKLTTSDIPGVAIKATQGGNTIGIALENFSSASSTTATTTEGTVLAFVKMGWWPTVFTPEMLSTSTLSAEDTSLLARVINAFKHIGVTIEQGIVRASEFISDKISANKLCLGETCVTETELKALLNNNQTAPALNTPIQAGQTSGSSSASDSNPPTAVIPDVPVAALASETTAPDVTEGNVSSGSGTSAPQSAEASGGTEVPGAATDPAVDAAPAVAPAADPTPAESTPVVSAPAPAESPAPASEAAAPPAPSAPASAEATPAAP